MNYGNAPIKSLTFNTTFLDQNELQSTRAIVVKDLK